VDIRWRARNQATPDLERMKMTTTRLRSRFMRPDDANVIASVQERLRAAGLVPVRDVAVVTRVEAVRKSVESIREVDEALKREPLAAAR
jgi:hypothetical protein